ncbi:MAG: pyridoxamine 5'-phosphate oxidase family protein [Actinomycetales bacterium]
MGIDDIEDLRGLGLGDQSRAALLDAATECTVCFAATDGWPAGVVMSFLVHEDALWLTAVQGRAHVRAVQADPRVTFVITSAGTGLPRQMLALRARIVVHDDEETRRWFLPAFAQRMAPADPESFVRLLDSPNRVFFEATEIRVAVSHDSTKMPGDGRGGKA